MTTAKQLATDIGRTGAIRLGALTVGVQILDTRRAYGNTQWLVTPITGSGSVWVNSVNLD